jgi:hypothetical protein
MTPEEGAVVCIFLGVRHERVLEKDRGRGLKRLNMVKPQNPPRKK